MNDPTLSSIGAAAGVALRALDGYTVAVSLADARLLVIEVAIVRPGPIQGGMVHPYLKRREEAAAGHKEPSRYPALDAALGRTLGVPIFQEQVMQICVIAAGFTPGEADGLRRAMAAWRRDGHIDQFETRIKEGMAQRGYDADFADAIFKQICGFGEYGFPESIPGPCRRPAFAEKRSCATR